MLRGMPDPQLLRCPSCGAQNRVFRERVGPDQKPVCGRCKGPLSQGVLALTDATFAAEVERSALPLLVDLWAAWCAPCRSIAPLIEELAAEMAGRVRFAKLDVDANPATARRFDVQGIPTLLLFQGGREVDRIVGAVPKSEIVGRLERLFPS